MVPDLMSLARRCQRKQWAYDMATHQIALNLPSLHLNLKTTHWLDIQAGTKEWEYRLRSKWAKRIEGKHFDFVLLKRGYPRRDDASRIIKRPWRGYEVQRITHPEFGPDEVEVLAIRVN